MVPLCQGTVSELAGQGRGAVGVWTGSARGLRGAGVGSGSHQRQLPGDVLAGAGGNRTWLSVHIQREEETLGLEEEQGAGSRGESVFSVSPSHQQTVMDVGILVGGQCPRERARPRAGPVLFVVRCW